jgi:uncharacterized protein YecA (UPF0149 family)
LKLNNPRCTRETLNRLMGLGYSKEESIKQIGAVLVEEIYDIMKNQIPFNEKSYAEKLLLLPNYLERDENEDNETIEIIRTPMNNDPKIGRNKICSCGSGKKYKKCCRM